MCLSVWGGLGGSRMRQARRLAAGTLAAMAPIIVIDRIEAELGSGVVISRRCRCCHEFQVRCSHYQCANMVVHPGAAVRDTVPMARGKTAICEWAILQRDSQSIRQEGHLGACGGSLRLGPREVHSPLSLNKVVPCAGAVSAKRWHFQQAHRMQYGPTGRSIS